MGICIVCGTRPEHRIENLTFHRFPRDEAERAIWISRIQEQRRYFEWHKRTLVCSKHFRSECFEHNIKRKRLKKGFRPTIFFRRVYHDVELKQPQDQSRAAKGSKTSSQTQKVLSFWEERTPATPTTPVSTSVTQPATSSAAKPTPPPSSQSTSGEFSEPQDAVFLHTDVEHLKFPKIEAEERDPLEL